VSQAHSKRNLGLLTEAIATSRIIIYYHIQVTPKTLWSNSHIIYATKWENEIAVTEVFEKYLDVSFIPSSVDGEV